MLIGAIVDCCVAKRSVLGFGWNGVALFKEEVFDIIFDEHAAGAVRLVLGALRLSCVGLS